MDMWPSEYIKVSCFWPQSAKIFLFVKNVQKTEKNMKKILKFFFHKNISKYHI